MALIGALFTIGVCWALGRILFDRLSIRLHRTEHDLLACVAGAPLLSLAVFALSCLGLARTPVFLLFAALFWFVRKPFAGTPFPPLPRLWRVLFLSAFAFYGVIYLANSLAPEKSPDGMAYHLGLVARYFAQHGFQRDTTNMYGFMPQGMEMLFLFAFSIGRHSASATVHCLALLALPWLILSYSRRIGAPRAGVVAAMLVFMSPLAGIDGVSAYNDIALATCAFSLFYLLEIWREQNDDQLLIPVGLLVGFCFAIKYTGFAAGIYALLVLRRRIRLIPVAAAASIALPWVIRNWLWTSNPFAPLFNSVFRNPSIHISFEKFYRGYFHTYNLPTLKPLFWMLTVTGQLGGQLGPVFLLAPIGLLAFRKPHGKWLLAASLCFLIPYPANIGARFLLPVLPFIALAIALAAWRPAGVALVVAAAILAWPRVIDKYRAPAGGWQITTVPWQAALGIIPERTWLLARSSEFQLAEIINAAVPATATIWSTDVLAEAYIQPRVLVNYYSAQGESIEDTLAAPRREDLQPLWRHQFSFPVRAFEHLRVLQNAVSDTDIWSIGEARFYLGFREVAPIHATAQPFPWDINLALDHNPTTRWRTWEAIRAGMHVDFIFPPNTQLDRVELDGSHDQWKIELRIQGLDAIPEKIELKPDADLRRLATRTVKARGIDYLLIGRNYSSAAEMRADPARWGLRLAGDRAGDALYQIQ